jgi:hypothetical protein
MHPPLKHLLRKPLKPKHPQQQLLALPLLEHK